MPVILPLLAAAIGIWTALLVRAGWIARLMPLVLLTGTIFGPPFFAINGPIQFSIDRLLWLVLMAFVAMYFLLGKIRLFPQTRGDWILLLWTLWVALSAVGFGPGLKQVNPVAQLLFYFVWPLGIYWAAKCLPQSAADLKAYIYVTIGLAIYLSLTAILETRGLHQFVFPRFIVDPTSIEFFGRGRGPLLNPIGVGLLMNVGFVACMMTWPQQNRLGKFLFALAALLILAGMYSTLTRSVWMGAAASVGLVAWRYLPMRFIVLGSVGIAMMLGLLLSGAGENLMEMKRDKHLSAAEAAESVKLRPILATVAWEMFKDRPLLGYGYARYRLYNEPYLHNRSYSLPLEKARPYIQHNVFLAQLVECGLVGLTLFILTLSQWTRVGLRLIYNTMHLDPLSRTLGMMLLAFIASYVINGMFHDVSVIPMVHMCLFALAGTCMQRSLMTQSQVAHCEIHKALRASANQ
jgi:O-antigen ligase